MNLFRRSLPEHRVPESVRRPPRRVAARTTLLLTPVLLVAIIAGFAYPAGRGPAAQQSPSSPAPSLSPTPSAIEHASPQLPSQVQVTIAAQAPTNAVPPAFLGISTEYWALPVWARHLPLLDRVLSLVRGDGPVQLRIGGDSADHVFWSPVRELPEWVFELTPGWLNEVSSIVRRSHVRLILDLNLVTASPRDATRWASTAVAKLPHSSILGFEIGNEPDIYSQTLWQSTTLGGVGSRVLPREITADSYVTAFAAYARALARVAPGVPLMGPALAEPGLNISWVSALLASPHRGLSAVTAHRYPFSACSQPARQTYPTIRRVLSEAATAGMAQTVGPAVRLAAQAGLPVRLTELNSVTCGGTRRVSNTFATALWAPDALFELVHAGVASADVHVRANAINAAFTLNRHGLTARPLLYGMILFARMLGPHPQLVGLRVQNRHHFHLKAWAVRTQGKVIHVLLIDKGQHSVRVGLRLPATGPATVQRLQAPSVRATSGMTLDGQRLDARGRWQGQRATELITPGPRGYQIKVARTSAALLTFHLRPGALARPHKH